MYGFMFSPVVAFVLEILFNTGVCCLFIIPRFQTVLGIIHRQLSVRAPWEVFRAAHVLAVLAVPVP